MKKVCLLITLFASVFIFCLTSDVYADTCPTVTDPTVYVIKFNSNGGGDVSDITISRDDTDASFPTPTKGNLTLTGWFLDSEFENSFEGWSTASGWDYDYLSSLQSVVVKDNNDCETNTREITLYARWSTKVCLAPLTGCIRYNFIYHDNTGDENNDISGKGVLVCGTIKDEDNPLSRIPEKSGYTFDGWYADKTLTRKLAKYNEADFWATFDLDADGCPKNVVRNANLYAKWNKNPETLVKIEDTGINEGTWLIVVGSIMVIFGLSLIYKVRKN